MKYILSILSTFMIATLVIISCKKPTVDLITENNKWVYVDSSKFANVRIIHCITANTPFLPTATATTGPQVFVYTDGAKLNGNALSYGGQWPSPNVYATVTSGSNVKFNIVMARMNLAVVPNVPAPIAGDTLFSFNALLVSGKFYSLYLGDSTNNYKGELIEDQLPLPAYQKYKLRLANYIMNPFDTLSLYSRRNGVEIIQNIIHKQTSNWVEYDLPLIADTLDLRKKGTTVNYATAIPFTPTGQRMYTVVCRGKTGLKAVSAGLLTNR
jgi:hypothetical protein